MNPEHSNISLTIDCEENNSLIFLDVKVFCNGEILYTFVYRKPTFSGVCTNFESFFYQCLCCIIV